MRHYIYSTLIAASAILALPSCESEATFKMNPGEGQLNCNALSVDYINRDRNTRADIEIGDFTVNFVNSATNETVRSFKYSEMPEIVALPAGNYRACAEYGDNAIARFENPYYTGNSTFGIEVGKVTDDVNPIECTLSNIKVTVNVSDLGMDVLGDDIKVIVSAGKDGSLEYNSSTNDKAGYFRYVDGSHTLTAEFIGTVDGVKVDKVVAYDDVAEGNSYRLNFQINRPDNMNPGSIQITDGFTLDATITIVNETHKINPEEPDDEIIKDDMRPVEGGNEPENPDPGKDPAKSGPVITSTSEGLVLNEVLDVTDGGEVKFNVSSETGITEFKILIDSTTLTADELDGVGLSANLDLINPGDFEEALNNLGFPTGDNVKGQTSIDFDISQFIPLLNMLGSGEHTFKLTVSDANGTATASIILKN